MHRTGAIRSGTRLRLLVVVVGASLAAWACGGNGADGGDSPPEIETFCDQSVALDELRRAPTDAELDNLLDNAPEGILAEVEILVSSAREFREGNEEAADSPEIQRAGRRFDAFVEKNCT